ncbi:MAG: hypothetical protein JXA71_11460 [Chitinispirillaceae bacterium]|nr:hypothetical protein [Chitinispirillaceae bacterium]
MPFFFGVRNVLVVACIFAVGMFSCQKEPASAVVTVDMNALIGKWITVKYIYQWDIPDESGGRDKGSESENVTDTSELTDISQNLVSWYNYDEGNCYDTSFASFTLSGNQLIGDEFNGQETDDDGSFSWSTTVSFAGNQLVATLFYSGTTSDGKSGWEKMSVCMNPYSGTIPPPQWPGVICSWGLSKKVQPKKHLPNLRWVR